MYVNGSLCLRRIRGVVISCKKALLPLVSPGRRVKGKGKGGVPRVTALFCIPDDRHLPVSNHL
jgi:hypothetical protein